MRKKSNYILKIAECGKRHPKHRKLFVALLAVAVFSHAVLKQLKKKLRCVPKAAAAVVAMVVVIGMFPSDITDGAETLYVTEDKQAEAQALIDNVVEITDGEIALESTIEESKELPWNLILINNENPLPEGYSFTPVAVRYGYNVDERIYIHLTEMLEAGKKEGLKLLVCSAYRSYESQVELFNEAYDEAIREGMSPDEAYEEAAAGYSLPGCSEHQAGLAVDIVANYHQYLDAAYGETPEGQWLYAHCHEYGFILRYPQDKEEITGIKYEPWHFRYVGVEAATEIMENNLTLEEYVQQYSAQ